MSKTRNASLQFKISSIYILTNLLVVVVNIGLLIGIIAGEAPFIGPALSSRHISTALAESWMNHCARYVSHGIVRVSCDGMMF